jgi:hypothetical protein
MTRRSIVAVFAIGLLFLAAMFRATGGRPSLPLDDSFIYFQYARQAAAGSPLSYHPGEPPTTGTTSLPWTAALAIGALLGFGGKSMIFFAMILGGLLLALAVRLAGSAEERLVEGPVWTAPGLRLPLASALVLLSGPLAWGAWSGMEIAAFAAAIAWAYREWAVADGRPCGRAVLATSVLAVVRPEGALLALVAAAAWLLAGRRGALAALPIVAAAAVQPLVNLLATGDPRSAGFAAKCLLAAPGADLLETLRVASLRAASLGGALFGGVAPLADGLGLYAYGTEAASLFVAPGAGILFLAGALPAAAREAGERRVGPALLGLLWLGTILVATCTLEEPDAHFSRYQMPILPVFLIWAAVGVGRIAQGLAGAGAGLSRLAAGIRGWLLVAGAVSVAFFALAFGDNCLDIDRMQIRLGESLRETLEPGAVVAINDAGALAYFSGRRTVDLVGLTTPGFAGLWPQGSGVLWEALEGLGPRERPGWFCIFPNWFDLDGIGLLRRQGSVRLLSPSIVDAEKVLFAADWSLAGSGDAPRLEGGGRVVDRLDVADPASERAHRFRCDDLEPGAHAGSFVRRADDLVDGGRTVFGEVEFDVARDPAAAATLVVRSVTGVRQRILVKVDGGTEREVEIWAPGSGRFHEQSIATIPDGEGTSRVRLRVVPRAAEGAALLVCHVFAIAVAGE